MILYLFSFISCISMVCLIIYNLLIGNNLHNVVPLFIITVVSYFLAGTVENYIIYLVDCNSILNTKIFNRVFKYKKLLNCYNENIKKFNEVSFDKTFVLDTDIDYELTSKETFKLIRDVLKVEDKELMLTVCVNDYKTLTQIKEQYSKLRNLYNEINHLLYYNKNLFIKLFCRKSIIYKFFNINFKDNKLLYYDYVLDYPIIECKYGLDKYKVITFNKPEILNIFIKVMSFNLSHVK